MGKILDSCCVFVCICCMCFASTVDARNRRRKGGYSDVWALEVKGGEEVAKEVSKQLGFKYLSPMGDLINSYMVVNKKRRRRRSILGEVRNIENLNYKIINLERPKVLSRPKRGFLEDPLFQDQWYLENTGQTSSRCSRFNDGSEALDINVKSVWEKNITGRGVVVSILDDGIDYHHDDLKRNYYSFASYDYNSNDPYPLPRDTYDDLNKHGTRCAGEVAGELGNGVCGVGVAYNSKVAGIRMLDGEVTDIIECASLSHGRNLVDIYSSSWGPDDTGHNFEGPGAYAIRAFSEGIRYGRNGLGSIFVWATGNGGVFGDYCSCDGYINSMYTIAIGAIDNCGRRPWYAEACPGTMAVTFSSGENTGGLDKQIVTTDLRNKCTKKHTGTSAAAPIAAGILALVLEANRYLTWRDMQHLISNTSRKVDPNDREWQTNGAGLHVNVKYGFGALDAEKLVEAARSPNWRTALEQQKFVDRPRSAVLFTVYDKTLNSYFRVQPGCINKLEHVYVILTLKLRSQVVDYERIGLRGHISIELTSPMGTKSEILRKRPRDMRKYDIENWEFLTLFHWGENPHGKWKLSLTDHSGQPWHMKNKLEWRMKFFGTCEL